MANYEVFIPNRERPSSRQKRWRKFIERVDGHDRSLFTNGLNFKRAEPPDQKPDGQAGQMYESREGARVSPIMSPLWELQGISPLPLLASESNMLATDIVDSLKNGTRGSVVVATAEEITQKFLNEVDQNKLNPNEQVIAQAVTDGIIRPTETVVYIPSVAEFYRQQNDLAAD